MDPDGGTQPIKPLSERTAEHVVSASALLRWYEEATHTTRGAAEGWIQPDDPSAEDLLVGRLVSATQQQGRNVYKHRYGSKTV